MPVFTSVQYQSAWGGKQSLTFFSSNEEVIDPINNKLSQAEKNQIGPPQKIYRFKKIRYLVG